MAALAPSKDGAVGGEGEAVVASSRDSDGTLVSKEQYIFRFETQMFVSSGEVPDLILESLISTPGLPASAIYCLRSTTLSQRSRLLRAYRRCVITQPSREPSLKPAPRLYNYMCASTN